MKNPGRKSGRGYLNAGGVLFQSKRFPHPVDQRLIGFGDLLRRGLLVLPFDGFRWSCHLTDSQVIRRFFAPAMASGSAKDFAKAVRKAASLSAGIPGGASQGRYNS